MRRFFFGSAALGALTMAMGVASAQTPPASGSSADQTKPAEAAPPTSADRIVVTGSLIKRDEFTTTSPVTIITKEEQTLAGLASTAELLQGTSTTGGNQQINNYFGGFVTDGGPGANTVSLRGLGATRTLVLLNGRRITPAGTRGSVGSADLNVLPQAIVNRVEILKDGASSIYGSDAVAGVINIITDDKLDGLHFEGTGNFTEHGGGNQYRASVAAGVHDMNYRLSGSLEYYEREDLTLGDRDWTQCNTDNFRNPTTGASLDYIDPLTGKPKCYPITTTGDNGVTINTLGTPSFAGVPAQGNPTLASYNRWRPNSAVTTGLVGFEGVSGGNINVRDTFDKRVLNDSLVSPAHTWTGFLQGGIDLHTLGNAELYFEQLATQRDSSQIGFRQLSLDYPTGSPLIPANIAAIPGNFLGPSSTAPYNTKARAFIGFGNYKSEQDAFFSKTTAGLRGDFFLKDWTYDVNATWSMSDATYGFEQFLTDRVIAAMTGCPAGSPAGCVVAPPLNSATLAGNLPSAFVNYIRKNVVGTTRYTEGSLSSLFTGPLFALPAGDVSAAIGFEYRKSKIDDTPGLDMINNNLYNFSTATPTRGDDAVKEAFAEVEAPLLKNQMLAKELTLNASARYTDYDSYGDDTTYKVGINYRPIDWVMLRASYGTSYRAPALFEQFLGATSGFQSNTTDPCNNYGSTNPALQRYKNCDSELHNTNFSQNQSVAVITAGGAAQGLSAETSKNTSVGLVFEPPIPKAMGDLSFAVDYYHIEVNDEVSRIGFANLLAFCYDDPQFRAGGGYCNFSKRTAGTNALTVFDNYINQATQKVEGIDYNLRWVHDLGPGTFRFNADVTQYLEQSSKLFDTDPLDDVNGTLRNPEYTGQFDFTYDIGKWRAFYRLTWVKSMDSYDFLGEDPATSQFDFAVPDYYLSNISARYRSDNNWEFTVGIRNLFDKEPDTISSGFYNKVGNALLYSGYDYVGRQVFVNIAKSF